MTHDLLGSSAVNGASSLDDRRMMVVQSLDGDLSDAHLGGGSHGASADFGAASWVHAFRRRWLLALVAGLAIAGIAAAGVWTWRAPQYSAVASVRVAARETGLMNLSQRPYDSDFETYKRTQRQLLLSQYVLNAALDVEVKDVGTVANLPLLKKNEADQIGWLQDNLRVSYPDDAEIMEIRLSGDDAKELQTIVNAVLTAYMANVVDGEGVFKRLKVAKLEKVFADTEAELRKKRTALETMSAARGGGNPQMLTLAQQNALNHYGALKGEQIKVRMQVLAKKGEYQLATAAMPAAPASAAPSSAAPSSAAPSSAESPSAESPANGSAKPGEAAAETRIVRVAPVSEMELENALAADAEVQAQIASIEQLKEREASAPSIFVKGDVLNQQLRAYRSEIAVREKQVQVRRQLIRERLQRLAQVAMTEKANTLQLELSVLQGQEDQLQVEVAAAAKLAGELGHSSIEVEMLRLEIDNLSAALDGLGKEIEQNKINLHADARITQPREASIPMGKDRNAQIAMTAAAGLAGFMLPVAGLMFIDIRKRLINAPIDVSSQLRLNVIGTLPLVPTAAFRNSGGRSRRLKRWRSLLDESVASVTAMLMRRSELDEKRVIMVTSAMPGEGKTTLAGQLATSLARAGRRTLLIDFDLRRPALDAAFDAPLAPGVTEVLCGECDLAEAIRPTSYESRLALLTAGDAHRNSLHQLTQDNVAALFTTVRDEYEFVIVDASPILPVVDARLLGQFVDGAILSVLRDVSQAPKVLAAREVLDVYDISFLGAVVIGAARGEVYVDYSQKQRTA